MEKGRVVYSPNILFQQRKKRQAAFVFKNSPSRDKINIGLDTGTFVENLAPSEHNQTKKENNQLKGDVNVGSAKNNEIQCQQLVVSTYYSEARNPRKFVTTLTAVLLRTFPRLLATLARSFLSE